MAHDYGAKAWAIQCLLGIVSMTGCGPAAAIPMGRPRRSVAETTWRWRFGHMIIEVDVRAVACMMAQQE
jgi:hypothetical protein